MNRKLILLSLAVIAVAATQGVLLRRNLVPNSTEVYKFESNLKQVLTIPAMGDQDMGISSSMKVTLKTGKVDPAGSAEIESTLSDIKAKGEGMLESALDERSSDIPKEIKNTGKVDARNHFTLEAKKATGVEAMMSTGSIGATSLMFIEFPEKSVAVGESWSYVLPKNKLFGSDPQSLTAKLVGERDYEGAKVWVISIAGTIKLNGDASEMVNAASGGDYKATLKGTINLTGEALVDKTTCRTLSYTTSSTSKSTIDMPDMGVTVESAGTSTTKMTLQK